MRATRFALISCGFILSLCSVGAAEIRYTLTDLGTLGGSTSNATRINNKGQVIGTSLNAAGQSRAFLYESGHMQDLGAWTPADINNFGQIVGTDGSNALLYESGQLQTLPQLAGASSSEATSINDLGQIVGHSRIGTWPLVSRAFVYAGGSLTNLGRSSSPLPFDVVYARAINNNGQVAGSQDTSMNDFPMLFMYSNGKLTELSGSLSVPRDINDAGTIVGYAWLPSVPDWPPPHRAFVYRNGNMDSLGTLGGSFSYANGINSADEIVGRSQLVKSESGYDVRSYHAFLVSGQSMFDLNNLIDPQSGWELINAVSINDLGQIVGAGWIDNAQHAFLLTPIPEPGASLIFLPVLASLLTRHPRRSTGRLSPAGR